jgi:hypothetical protein
MMNDHCRAWEWRCVCGCINDSADRRCWECNADTDGNQPKEDDDEGIPLNLFLLQQRQQFQGR